LDAQSLISDGSVCVRQVNPTKTYAMVTILAASAIDGNIPTAFFGVSSVVGDPNGFHTNDSTFDPGWAGLETDTWFQSSNDMAYTMTFSSNNASVPDSGSTALMLGIAVPAIGFMVRRRRR
jgi:hypothetical protein